MLRRPEATSNKEAYGLWCWLPTGAVGEMYFMLETYRRNEEKKYTDVDTPSVLAIAC